MKELLHRDLQWVLRRTPSNIVKVMKDHPKRVFLAGGFIRACVAGEAVADFDLFTPSKDMAELVALKLDGARRWTSENAVTVHAKEPNVPPTQVIHRWTYDRPEDLVESFDFTVAKAAVWCTGAGWASTCHDDFYADLVSRRLVYVSPVRNEDAGGSMLRVLKFYQKGYRMPLDSLAAVVARLVAGVDPTKLYHGHPDARAREAWLAGTLCGLLREVDPLVDPKHLMHFPATPDGNLEAQQPRIEQDVI
jgi:hypothetical protein